MEKKQYFCADNLYILFPYKIVNIVLKNVKSSKRIAHGLQQNVLFECSSSPVFAFFDDASYHGILPFNSVSKNYFSESILKANGVSEVFKFEEFVDVFAGDATLFSDFLFAQNLGSFDKAKRIKYFEHPFSFNNMELKEKYRVREFEKKPFYTLDELLNFYQHFPPYYFSENHAERVYNVTIIPSTDDFSYDSYRRYRYSTSSDSLPNLVSSLDKTKIMEKSYDYYKR